MSVQKLMGFMPSVTGDVNNPVATLLRDWHQYAIQASRGWVGELRVVRWAGTMHASRKQGLVPCSFLPANGDWMWAELGVCTAEQCAGPVAIVPGDWTWLRAGLIALLSRGCDVGAGVVSVED